MLGFWFNSLQVVSKPMVVCGEGGDVFMVSTQQGQRKPKWPTHKDPREKKERKEKPNKGILLMVLNNVVVRGSHGHRRAGFPWMCVQS